MPQQFSNDKRLHFVTDSLRPKSWLYILGLAILLVFSYAVFDFADLSKPFSCLIPNLIVYGTILTLVIFKRCFQDGWPNILAPDVLFVAFYSIVLLGYVSLFAAEIVPYSSEVFYFSSSIPKSMFAITIGAIAFLIGNEAAGSTTRRPSRVAVVLHNPHWELIGGSLIALGITMHFFGLLSIGFDVISNRGYAVIQNNRFHDGSGLTTYLIRFGTKAIAIGILSAVLSSALRAGKLFDKKIIFIMTIISFLFVILEGDRGQILSFGLPILLVRHFLVKPLRMITLGTLAFCVLVSFVVLGSVRSKVFNPVEMINEYQVQAKEKPVVWYGAFVELGSSYNTINITTKVVPNSEPFWHGRSWLDSAVHTVPFLQGVLAQEGLVHVTPSKWLTRTFWGEGRSGRAFSLTAEGYLNFGFIGVFAELFAIGWFARWLFIRFCNIQTIAVGIITFGCFGILILSIRNHANMLVAPCFHIFLLVWIIETVISRTYRSLT